MTWVEENCQLWLRDLSKTASDDVGIVWKCSMGHSQGYTCYNPLVIKNGNGKSIIDDFPYLYGMFHWYVELPKRKFADKLQGLPFSTMADKGKLRVADKGLI